FGGVSNVDLGKGYPSVARAFEGNERASVDFLFSIANYRPACSTVQVDIRCPSLTLNPLPSGGPRNIDVPAETLMFLLCPGSHFFYRQSVVVQHDLILQCAGAERAFSTCSTMHPRNSQWKTAWLRNLSSLTFRL